MKNVISDWAFKTVMLIDDNTIDNFVHRRLLEDMKIAKSFMEFSDPAEAISYLKMFNKQSEENSIDLILLDINMPGIDGWLFLDQLEILKIGKFFFCTKIIILSSTCNEEEVKRVQSDTRLSGFIPKPLNRDKFLNTLKIF
jgi:CheY-like chemotaxis protein